jgi:hypothetical protein
MHHPTEGEAAATIDSEYIEDDTGFTRLLLTATPSSRSEQSVTQPSSKYTSTVMRLRRRAQNNN